MSFSRHFFTAIQVQKLIHLWCCQTISNFKILHDEHLPGDRVLQEARLAFWFAWGVDLVLKLHLYRRERTQNNLYILFKSDFLFKM